MRIRIVAPGEGVVVDFAEDRDWYADGWSARRVADMLAERADAWRVDQIVNGDITALEQEQVATIEAASTFFALIARLEAGDYASAEEMKDELTDAIREVGKRGDGVILEETYRL